MATSLKINAASFISPGDLAKAQHMLDRESSKSGEILMRTAAHSIASGIRTWASSNRASFQSDIDKALQPFLNSMRNQVLKTLGGAAGGTSSSSSSSSSSTPRFHNSGAAGHSTLTPTQYNAMPTSHSRAGGGGGGGGHAAGEAFGVAMTMEAVHSMYEQIAEVRNEMYQSNISASNLQRQMLFSPTKDVRGFTNAASLPGMELGYTREESLAAISTLAKGGGQQSQAQLLAANKAMSEFSNVRGLELGQWAGLAAGGEEAGLFGGARGTKGGAEGIEGYQSRVAGLYGLASKAGPGGPGTTQYLDEFTSSINSLSTALGDATGNSEDAAKSFEHLDVKGNVYSMFNALQNTGNQAYTGQKGVQLLMGVNSSIQNQVFGSPMQQAMAYATHPGMSMGQIFAAQSKGLTDPSEFRKQMKFINANYKGDDRELALHQLYGTSYGGGKALEDIYSTTGGKGTTKEQLEAASKIQGYGEDSQAKAYRTAMDALTKSMEELSQIVAPILTGFDKLQGATHGLAGIFLMTFGAMKGKKWLEGLLGGEHLGKGKHGGLVGEIAELAKGKGQPVYVTNEFLRVVGMGSGIQSMGKGLIGEAEAVGEGALPGVLPEAAAMGGVGELAGAGIGAGELGLTGLSLGGLASGAGGLLATLAAPEVMLPLAAVVATGYAVTHPKQVGSFLGGATKFAGNALFQASGIPEVASLAQGAWKDASAVTSFLLGSKTAGRIGTELGHDISDPFGITSALFGKHGKGGLRGNLFGTNKHVGGALGDLASAWVGDPLKNAWQTVAGAPGRWMASMNKIGQGEGLFSKIGKEGILGTIGSTFLDTFSLETDKHKHKTETARFAHLIAANKMIESLLGKHLDPNAPLGPQLVADITSRFTSLLKGIWNGASKFFQGFIKNLGDLWTHLFGSKPPGHPAAPAQHPHHATPHQGSGAIAATTPSGGNTVTLAPIKLHITVQDSKGHTTTKVINHHPLRHVAAPYHIGIGPQHHRQPNP